MLGGDRRAVVVVASISTLNIKVRLSWERAANVRESVVRQPTRAIIVGLARVHLVTRRIRITIDTVRRNHARHTISPGGCHRAHRKVSLPLWTGRGIGVQLQRRSKGNTIIGGANVIDVASITASAMLGIDVVNYPIEGGRLTPAHVPPIATVVWKHKFEVADSANTRSVEGGAGIGVRKVAPPSVDLKMRMLRARLPLPPFSFMPATYTTPLPDMSPVICVLRMKVRWGNLNRAVPCGAVVSGVGNEEAANVAAVEDVEVVPGNIHPPVEGRRWVVLHPSRFPVIVTAVVNAEMRVQLAGFERVGGACTRPSQSRRTPCRSRWCARSPDDLL